MSHIILQQPDGQWCIWSTVVDDFIVSDVGREFIIVYELEKERNRLNEKLDDIEVRGGDYYHPPRSYEDLVELREHLDGLEEGDDE